MQQQAGVDEQSLDVGELIALLREAQEYIAARGELNELISPGNYWSAACLQECRSCS